MGWEYFKLESNGSKSGVVNGTGTPQRWIMAPQGAQQQSISALRLVIQSADTTLAQYGGLTLSDGQGLTFLKERFKPGRDAPDTLEALFSGEEYNSILELADLGQLEALNASGATLSSVIQIPLLVPVVLNARHYERLAVPLTGNFSALTRHRLLGLVDTATYG